jgi:PhzF family phenazine biosynthesis protein
MVLNIFQVDAFTNDVFGGNPAAVCPLEHWLDAKLMQKIAAENNLSETVFFVPKENYFEIRWFMPHDEIDLCGHATLAAAFVIFNHSNYSNNSIQFQSQSGPLNAQRSNDGTIVLNFPSRPPKSIPIPKEVLNAFEPKPIEAAADRDLILLFENEQQIKTLNIDVKVLKKLPYICIVPTSKGNTVDFVSRVFDANADVPEDPVTGSTHCSLIPFWNKKLNKTHFNAKQLSKRGGDLKCQLIEDRVTIAGKAVLYLKGEIFVP